MCVQFLRVMEICYHTRIVGMETDESFELEIGACMDM